MTIIVCNDLGRFQFSVPQMEYPLGGISKQDTSGETIWDRDIVWDTLNMYHFLL